MKTSTGRLEIHFRLGRLRQNRAIFHLDDGLGWAVKCKAATGHFGTSTGAVHGILRQPHSVTISIFS